jgi:hypothetical protein
MGFLYIIIEDSFIALYNEIISEVCLVAKLEEKWWGAKLPPLGVHRCLMLKLEGTYMMKTSQL